MSTISTERDGAILRITLNRPEKLNALDTPTLTELHRRLTEAADDSSVRVVALTGAGRAFSSGGGLSGKNTKGAVRAANLVVSTITRLPKPVVAGVHGPAVGLGCPLALACDLVVAKRSAYFQLAFARVGLMLDGGASVLLPRAIGRARAARMAMTAEKVSAATAFDWVLVSHVVDDTAYEAELAAVTSALAAGPTQSFRWIKRAFAAATLSHLETVQAIDEEGQRMLVQSNDYRRGVEAFRAGRQPQFAGD